MRTMWMALALAGCTELGGVVPQAYPTCGGLLAIGCDDPQLVCVDTPGDGCSEYDGGFDCSGICAACDDPGVDRTVVSDDPKECGKMDFDCEKGEVQWSDECGCGCEPR
jgi:hypothetical protein